MEDHPYIFKHESIIKLYKYLRKCRIERKKNIENIHIVFYDYSYIFEHTYQNGQKLDNDIPHF